MLRLLFNKGLAIACLLSIFVLTFITSAHRMDFRVTAVSLRADPARMGGPCPLKVVFHGLITMDGPGIVNYTFTSSDGATGPVLSMDFKVAGTQPVSSEWTLGDYNLLPHFEGWQAIKILSPNVLESERALFEGTCVRPRPSPEPPRGESGPESLGRNWDFEEASLGGRRLAMLLRTNLHLVTTSQPCASAQT